MTLSASCKSFKVSRRGEQRRAARAKNRRRKAAEARGSSAGLLPYDTVFLLNAGSNLANGRWMEQGGFRLDPTNYVNAIATNTAINLLISTGTLHIILFI